MIYTALYVMLLAKWEGVGPGKYRYYVQEFPRELPGPIALGQSEGDKEKAGRKGREGKGGKARAEKKGREGKSGKESVVT